MDQNLIKETDQIGAVEKKGFFKRDWTLCNVSAGQTVCVRLLLLCLALEPEVTFKEWRRKNIDMKRGKQR